MVAELIGYIVNAAVQIKKMIVPLFTEQPLVVPFKDSKTYMREDDGYFKQLLT
jgi:hypothetical protein